MKSSMASIDVSPMAALNSVSLALVPIEPTLS
jgi:hypothetical protein